MICKRQHHHWLVGQEPHLDKELSPHSVCCRLPALSAFFFHGYSGSKEIKWGKELEKAAKKGILPMAACLLGTEAVPPLWQHSSGSNFVVGAKRTSKRGCLSQALVDALLQAWWKQPLESSSSLFDSAAYHITEVPKLDHQTLVPPNVTARVFGEAGAPSVPEPQQSIPLQIRAAQARAQFLCTRQDWSRLGQHDQDMEGLSIWCTGLGGGDPPGSWISTCS